MRGIDAEATQLTTKILLVDDNPDLRRILQIPITWMGFEPITASNGKEAVERAITEKPDLILMDFVMPAMNGERRRESCDLFLRLRTFHPRNDGATPEISASTLH